MEIVGKYASAEVYAETIEEDAIKQIYDICNCPASEGNKIRIMADVHAGKGITIGYSSTLSHTDPIINPSHVGVDIGCSVSMMKVSEKLPEEKYKLFEHRVKERVPMGFNINLKSVVHEKDFYKYVRSEISRACACVPLISKYFEGEFGEKYLKKMLQRVGMDEGTFWKSLGSVGGGNHYLEYDEGEDGSAWLSVHCGSRNFGLKVAKYWIRQAEKPKHVDTSLWAKELDIIKSTTPKDKWNETIKKRKSEMLGSVPNGYLAGDSAWMYLVDMVIAQAYAKFNHNTILSVLYSIYKDILCQSKVKNVKVERTVYTTHNYVDFDDFIIRKGAVNASKGKMLAIPMNMRDGVLICIGKGNSDWNCTAPHGAGRLMSRSKAKATLSMDEFREEMKDIYTTSVDTSTIDESPMAYKPMDEIIRLIEPTVEILEVVKPKINWKASE